MIRDASKNRESLSEGVIKPRSSFTALMADKSVKELTIMTLLQIDLSLGLLSLQYDHILC